MTETQTADFTAARILAVAARDAVERLIDEMHSLDEKSGSYPFGQSSTKLYRELVEVVPSLQQAIGAWTRADDLQPQPKYEPFVDPDGDDEMEAFETRGVPKPKCPLSGDPVCPTDQCPPQCELYAGCGVKGRSDAATAEDAAVELAKAIAKSLGVTVRVIKL